MVTKTIEEMRNPLLKAVVALLANTSVGVKAVSIIVLLSYCLSYSESAILALSVTPGYFWPPHFWLWTAFTHCFLEIHWWEVLVDIVTVVLVGKLLEPLWGTLEMVIFFGIVNSGVALVAAVFYYFLYMVTFNTELLFEVHIHGLAGYLAGVSVAVKQAMPDHVIYRSPVGKITNRNIPLACFLLTFIMWAIGLVEGSYCTMFGSGLVISWIYLRFYQLHANGSRGDTADSFSFASFFPNVMQPPINACFSILVRLRICKKRVRRYDIGGGSSSGAGPAISISLPGVDNHDTERRRQIALKALKDRLSKTENQSASESNNWPSLEDDASSTANTTSESSKLLQDISASGDTMTASGDVQIDIEKTETVLEGEDGINDDDKKPLLSTQTEN